MNVAYRLVESLKEKKATSKEQAQLSGKGNSAKEADPLVTKKVVGLSDSLYVPANKDTCIDLVTELIELHRKREEQNS